MEYDLVNKNLYRSYKEYLVKGRLQSNVFLAIVFPIAFITLICFTGFLVNVPFWLTLSVGVGFIIFFFALISFETWINFNSKLLISNKDLKVLRNEKCVREIELSRILEVRLHPKNKSCFMVIYGERSFFNIFTDSVPLELKKYYRENGE